MLEGEGDKRNETSEEEGASAKQQGSPTKATKKKVEELKRELTSGEETTGDSSTGDVISRSLTSSNSRHSRRHRHPLTRFVFFSHSLHDLNFMRIYSFAFIFLLFQKSTVTESMVDCGRKSFLWMKTGTSHPSTCQEYYQ